MDDYQLLRLAAKAAGIEVAGPVENFVAQIDERTKGGLMIANDRGGHSAWNPLNDDGDALRLAVDLGMAVTQYPIYERPKHAVIAKQYQRGDMMREANPTEVLESHNGDPRAATRRAIVRAAAEIGKSLPK